jgi:hypothetical protein
MSLPPDHRRNAMTSDNVVFEIADQLRRERGLSGVYLGHLYLAATAMDLRRYVPPKRLTIQESTIALRSLAHYRARGEYDLARGFAALLDHDAHPVFACSILLTASIAARRDRLEIRRREAPEEIADDDLAVLTSPDLFRRMDDILIDETTRRECNRTKNTGRTQLADKRRPASRERRDPCAAARRPLPRTAATTRSATQLPTSSICDREGGSVSGDP